MTKKKDGVRSTSFFVAEFDDKWMAKDLYYDLKDLGEIDEVVIPPRRYRRGRRFGFV